MFIGLKRLRWVFAAVIGLGIAAIVTTTATVSRSAMREAVQSQIRLVTGLDLSVEGDIDISLFPAGTVTFNNVRLRGDHGDKPALVVDTLTANLRILPLVLHRFEIADLILGRARFMVTRDADGTTNWSHIAETLARTLKPGPSRIASFSEIRIDDGMMIFDDPSQHIHEVLAGIDMSLAWPSISRSFGATGRFAWRGERLDTSLTMGDFFAALSGEPSSLKLRLSAPVAKLAFDGTMSRNPDLKLEGTMAMDSPNLRKALRWVGLSPLAETGFGRYALKAKTAISGTAIALSNVIVELDGNRAEGVLSYSSERRKTLQGTLAADSVDLTPYIADARQTTQGHNWSQRQFDLDGMRSVDLDIRLSAGAVTMGSSKIGRTALAANLHAGDLTLSIAEAQVFGGTLRGSINVAAATSLPALRTQLQFTDIDFETAGTDMVGIRRISGRGNLSIALDTEGDSIYELTRNLNGTALLTGQNGAIGGFNVEQLLRRLEKRPLSGGGAFGGQTPYTTLNVAVRFSKGVAMAENIHIENKAIRLSLTGEAAVPERQLNLKGIASLIPANTTVQPDFELPFVLEGPWDNPLIMPDPDILLRRSRASAPLLDAVRERKARDLVRSAIEKLTGVRPNLKPASGEAPAPVVAPSPAAPAAIPQATPPAASNRDPGSEAR